MRRAVSARKELNSVDTAHRWQAAQLHSLC